MNKERLLKEYPWLFKKDVYRVEQGKKVRSTKEFNPIIEEHDSHWRVYREEDSSPLILSKNF